MRMVRVITLMARKASKAPHSRKTASKATPAARTTFTSVPVKPETLRRLRSYKVGGKTYDDVLNEFMDETPASEFWAEMERQMKAPTVPWEQVKRRLKL